MPLIFIPKELIASNTFLIFFVFANAGKCTITDAFNPVPISPNELVKYPYFLFIAYPNKSSIFLSLIDILNT